MGKNLTVFFTGLFLALGIAAAGGAVCYGLIAGKQANRTVSVRGLAEREVDAGKITSARLILSSSRSMSTMKRRECMPILRRVRTVTSGR